VLEQRSFKVSGFKYKEMGMKHLVDFIQSYTIQP
jgi:hypothetical protein